MKTSNKILLGIISVIGLTMLSILVFAKSSLINYTENHVSGNGNIIVKTHNIGEIAFFQAKHNYDVFVKKGAPLLTIETDENIHEFLNPHISDKNSSDGNKKGLRIGQMEDVNLNPSEKIKMYLTVPTLEEVSLSGFSTITFEDTLETSTFSADVHGSSVLDLKVSTQDINISTSGHSRASVLGQTGDTKIKANGSSHVELDFVDASIVDVRATGHSEVYLTGKTTKLDADLTGSSNLVAGNLQTKNTQVSLSGHSTAQVKTDSTLNVNASGSSDVRYTGNPQITKNLSGHSSIKKIE